MDENSTERVTAATVALDPSDIERIASRSVQKLLEPLTLEILAEGIAAALRNRGLRYAHETAELGERLDANRY